VIQRDHIGVDGCLSLLAGLVEDRLDVVGHGVVDIEIDPGADARRGQICPGDVLSHFVQLEHDDHRAGLQSGFDDLLLKSLVALGEVHGHAGPAQQLHDLGGHGRDGLAEEPIPVGQGHHRLDADDVETLAGEVIDGLHVGLRGQGFVVDGRHHDVELGVGLDAVDREGQLGDVELRDDAPEHGGGPACYLDAAGPDGLEAVSQSEQRRGRMELDLVLGLGGVELVHEILLDVVGDRVTHGPRLRHPQDLGIAGRSRGGLGGRRGGLGRSRGGCGGFLVPTAGGHKTN